MLVLNRLSSCRTADSSIDSRYQAYWRDTWYATTATDKLSVGDTAFYLPKDAWSKAQIDSKNYKVFNPEFMRSLGNDYSTVSNRVFLHLKKFDDVKTSYHE